jgi:hypothetical protein
LATRSFLVRLSDSSSEGVSIRGTEEVSGFWLCEGFWLDAELVSDFIAVPRLDQP